MRRRGDCPVASTTTGPIESLSSVAVLARSFPIEIAGRKRLYRTEVHSNSQVIQLALLSQDDGRTIESPRRDFARV